MFYDLSATESVQMILTVFVVITCTVFALVVLAILAPERLFATSEQNTPAWSPGELAHPDTHFREPADPSYVDELIRIRATAPVIHNPDPHAVDNLSSIRPVEQSPYYLPGVGRHRAPERVLVAA